jgi:hypothetical protein
MFFGTRQRIVITCAFLRAHFPPLNAVNFSVGNADSLFANNPNNAAFNNLAGPNSDPNSFDVGLPFFFGRAVYTAIEGQNTTAGIGPYFAY